MNEMCEESHSMNGIELEKSSLVIVSTINKMKNTSANTFGLLYKLNGNWFGAKMFLPIFTILMF